MQIYGYIFKIVIIISINIVIKIEYLYADDSNTILSFYNISAVDIEGNTIKMEKYKGKKVLIVNVASKCGFTPQYQGLQNLHEQYGNQLVILGFPSNDYFWQEPGTNQEIKNFCKSNYGVTFQMFEKIHVKGSEQHLLYSWLSSNKLNGWNDQEPSWNFCKYLISETGKLIDFFKYNIEPTDSLITRYLQNN